MGAADCSAVMGGMCITSLGGFITLPGGYCTASCSPTTSCGAGATCLSIGFGGGGGQCVATCTTSADCRASEGYACQMLPFGGGGRRVCVPSFGGGMRDGGISFGDAMIPPIPFDLGF